jgi:osmotically inducible protein OsmC
MAKVLYTAHAHVTGGRVGHGRTTDGQLELDLRVPKEMGGDGGATNPEQLFAVGYAACFVPSPPSLGAVTWMPVRSRSTLR